MPNVKSKYFNIAELLHSGLVVSLAKLLFQKKYVPNGKFKHSNIAELLHNAAIVILA